MGSSEDNPLFGSTKEDVDQAQSLASYSQDDSPLTEMLELDQVSQKFPDYQDLDSDLEGSFESDESKTEFAASFPTVHKDGQSEIEGSSTYQEVTRAKLTCTKDFQDVETQEATTFLRQQTADEYGYHSP